MRLIKDSLADIHFIDFKNRKNITLSQEKNYSHLEAISSNYESFLWSENFNKIVKREKSMAIGNKVIILICTIWSAAKINSL